MSGMTDWCEQLYHGGSVSADNLWKDRLVRAAIFLGVEFHQTVSGMTGWYEQLYSITRITDSADYLW